jgi:hypothetical protein
VHRDHADNGNAGLCQFDRHRATESIADHRELGSVDQWVRLEHLESGSGPLVHPLHPTLKDPDGTSFCKRLTSQAENVPRSIDVAIAHRTAIIASPFPCFEALRPFWADASAFGTGLSAEVPRSVYKRRCARNRFIAQHIARYPAGGIGRRLSVRRLEAVARLLPKNDRGFFEAGASMKKRCS